MSSTSHMQKKELPVHPQSLVIGGFALLGILAIIVISGIRAHSIWLSAPMTYTVWGAVLLASLLYSERVNAIETTVGHTLVPLLLLISACDDQIVALLPLIAAIAWVGTSVMYRHVFNAAIRTLGSMLCGLLAIWVCARVGLLPVSASLPTDAWSWKLAIVHWAATAGLATIIVTIATKLYDIAIHMLSGGSFRTLISEYSISSMLTLMLSDITMLTITFAALSAATSAGPPWPSTAVPMLMPIIYGAMLRLAEGAVDDFRSHRRFEALALSESSFDHFIDNPDEIGLDHLRRGLKGFRCYAVHGQEPPQRLTHARRRSSIIVQAKRPMRFIVERNIMQRIFTHSDQRVIDTIASAVSEATRAHRESALSANAGDMDLLTGVMSYRSFLAYLKELQKSGESGLVAIIYINIDRFRRINDQYGYEVGNEILQLTASRIRNVMNDHTLLARVGGDEFAVIATAYDTRKDIETLAADIRKEVSTPAETDAGVVSLAVSTGLSMSNTSRGFETLLSDANTRMYQSLFPWQPMNSSNGLKVTSENMEQLSALNASETVTQAIRGGTFGTLYQPIFDMQTRRIVSLTAQVRIADPDYGCLPPAFISTETARLGLSSMLATQTLNKAVEDMGHFRSISPELTNIHIHVNGDELFNATFLSLVEQVGADYPQITLSFDLGENLLRTISPEFLENLSRFSTMPHVSLGFDHLGTTFSETAAFIQIPVKTVKIDRSLTGDIHDDRSVGIVTGLLHTLRQAGIMTVFSGVDNAKQADFVSRVHGRYVEGLLYGSPLTSPEFRMRLEMMGLSIDADEGVAPPSSVGR